MFKVTIEFNTAADAAQFLMDFDSAPSGEVSQMSATSTGRPRGRPRKEATMAAAPTPAATAPAAPVAAPAVAVSAAPAAPVAPATAEAPAVAFEALVDPLTELADKDLDAALAILAKHGVKQARELKPAQYGTVLAEVKAKLDPPAAARPSLI